MANPSPSRFPAAWLRPVLVAGTLLISALACGGGGGGGTPMGGPPGGGSNTTVRLAILSGDDETPASGSAARGVALITVDSGTKAISGTVLTTGIDGVASHIHQGAKGAPGGVIIPLSGGDGGVWTVPAGTTLTDAQYTAFTTNGLYVNVHTAAFPSGEIRGQIAFKAKYASLTAAQETPGTGAVGTGIGALAVDPLSGEIRGGIHVSGVTGTQAHIHQAAAGSSGAVIVGLLDAGNGTWMVPVNSVLTPAQVAAFDGDGLYFNIHTAANPGGEIRGQINLASQALKSFTLAGSQEVPGNASTAAATATVALDPATLQVRGSLLSTGITGTGAHIHEGAAGVSGPIAVPFTAAGAGAWRIAPGWILSAGQFGKWQSGALYANIHSAAYPAGEIRGQLPVDPATSTGGGGGGGGGGGY